MRTTTTSTRARARTWRAAAATLAAAALLAGCSGQSGGSASSAAAATPSTSVTTSTTSPTTSSAAVTTTPPPTSTTPLPPADPALAGTAVAAADRLNDGSARYAVAVYDRANQKLAQGRYATMPIMSASVIKLYVIVDLLHQREQGALTLSAADTERIHRSLSGSDDNAMNALWSSHDGMGALRQIIGLAGLRQTKVPDDPGQWGEATISASDTVLVYRYLLASLNSADRDLVLSALSNPTHYGLADGFDQEFGLLGPGVRPAHVAAKQGWIGYRPYRFLHTTGLLGSHDQYIAVILTRQSNSLSYPAVAAHVTAATGAMLKALGSAAVK